LASQWSVDTTKGLLAELRVLLGPTCLRSSLWKTGGETA
jgi:hypothetical protein